MLDPGFLNAVPIGSPPVCSPTLINSVETPNLLPASAVLILCIEPLHRHIEILCQFDNCPCTRVPPPGFPRVQNGGVDMCFLRDLIVSNALLIAEFCVPLVQYVLLSYKKNVLLC